MTYRLIGAELQRQELLKRIARLQDTHRSVPHKLMFDLRQVTTDCLARRPRAIMDMEHEIARIVKCDLETSRVRVPAISRKS